jgi:hypothetical protein
MNSLNNLVKNSWRTAVVLVLLLCAFPAQAVEIRFVTWRETQGFLDRLIQDFEAQNPDLKIVREIGPHSSTEFHDLVGQKFKNRDPEMDVFFMDVIWPAEFASAGWALPLDRFFPPDEQKKFSRTLIRDTFTACRCSSIPGFSTIAGTFCNITASRRRAPGPSWSSRPRPFSPESMMRNCPAFPASSSSTKASSAI